MLVDGKSSFQISLSMSTTDTQGYFHHNHQIVVLWITQTIPLCGYPWPVQYWSTDAPWPFSVSAHSAGISASAWYNLHSVDTESRKFILHATWGTDAASCFIIWMLSGFLLIEGFRHWMLIRNVFNKGNLSWRYLLERFRSIQELYHILMKQYQSRTLIYLQFLQKSWHLTVLADIYGAGMLHPEITDPVYLTESAYWLSYSDVYSCFLH